MPNDALPSGTEIDSTVEAAADSIAALLASDEDTEPDAADDTPDAPVAEEEQDEEPDAAAEAPEETEPVSTAPIRLSDGTTLTLEEVEKGYLRQADYTRKTQAVAEQRKAQETEFEAVRAERQQYATQLQMLAEVLASQGPDAPPPELRQTDPAEYAARMADVMAHQQHLATVAAKQQQVQSQVAADQAAKQAQYLAAERERLLDVVPEWRDQAIATRDLQALRAVGAEYGFSDQELDSVADHRALLLLRDAKAWRDHRKATDHVKPKIAKAPVLKPGAQGAVAPKSAPDTQKALSRLKSTGKVDDAARALKAIGL